MLTSTDLWHQARERAALAAEQFANKLIEEGDHFMAAGDIEGARAKWLDAAGELAQYPNALRSTHLPFPPKDVTP